MDGEVIKYLSQVNQRIRKGCTAHITKNGRLYYMNHETKTSSWLPPVESWDAGGMSLPYGWEAAFDREGKTYFINHVNRTTTCEDPRKDSDEEPPQPREIELIRDPQKGFGFVAGSEKPVIVRFVTEGGPSEGKLLPGDQILQINGEDVMKSPRERVIELVRSCKHLVKLRVCQPFANNTTRKSALLTAAKKAKLKSNPSRVRFAEGVVINGSPLYCPSPFDSTVPFMPNVLKVFLENGQTKSFKYDSTTTVQDVLNVLQEKLSITSLEHFSLVVEHIKSIRRNKLSILNSKDTLAKIAARPGAHNLRCLFRITFVPKDIYEFMQRDPVTFDYFYVQCCNDVVHERFAPELKYDVALRLAALHLQQHALASGIQGKLTVKTIEREFGLEKFVPVSLLDTMKRKELLKILSQLMKQNQALSSPGQKQLNANQAKFHYLKIVSDLPSYGAKCFATCCKNSAMESAILIGPRVGVSQVSTIRNIAPMNLAQFGELESVEVTREDDFSYKIRIRLRNQEKECLAFNMEDRETEEFVLVLESYYSQLVGDELLVEWEGRDPEPVETVPAFHSRHTVQEAPWNYCPPSGSPLPQGSIPRLRSFDLSMPPPPYIPCEERQLSRSNSRDQFSIATSPTSVDHNMNEMEALVAALSSLPNFKKSTSENSLAKASIREDQSFSKAFSDVEEDDHGLQTTDVYGRTLKTLADQPDTVAAQLQRPSDSSSGIDMHSVVSMELLEEVAEEGGNSALQQLEIKSNDVLIRVSEMNKIVNDAERYLMNDDSSGDLASRCQDSLQFAHRNEGQVGNFDQLLVPSSDLMPSESEAESTPTNSPNHCAASVGETPEAIASKMWSSFGLHSPHIFAAVDQETEDVEELLRQLQVSTNLPLGESSLCLDPDIIDLTIVPPPNATDVDFSQVTPDASDSTSKSFLDIQSFCCKESGESIIGNVTPSQLGSQQFYSNHPGILFSNSSCYDSSYCGCSSTSDPSSSGYESCGISSGDSLPADEDDLAAYIIPPPPPSSSSLVEEQNRVLARFREAAEEVRRMVAQEYDSLSCTKYADSMNSVSKFCTIPRRHDDSHRTPLSSLASLVTPIRETHSKSFASALSGVAGSSGSVESGNNSDDTKHTTASGYGNAMCPLNGISGDAAVGVGATADNSDQRPRRPPRQKRINPPTTVNSTVSASSENQSEPQDPSGHVNGYVDSGRPNGNSGASGNFSRNSFGSSSQRSNHETSQENMSAETHLQDLAYNSQAINHSGSQNYHLANGHLDATDIAVPELTVAYEQSVMNPKLTNGYGHGPIVNGVCNSFEPGTPNGPISLPEDVLKECHVCLESKNGFVNGCACRKLGQFRSYHQSLPRKAITSGFRAFPASLTNGGTLENGLDDTIHESGLFREARQEITEMVVNLDSACQLRMKECTQNEQMDADPIKLAKVRETLMSESRQFVTASKLFVKSITESSDKMEENLVMCLALLDRIFAVSELVVMEMTKPSQINTLVEKLREMALAYSRTVSAAHCAASGEIPNQNMAGLMHQATSLATSLTTLMRTLRTFHSP